MDTSVDLTQFQIPVDLIKKGQLNASILSGKKGAMILFYADWCFHCRNMKPIYKKIADENKNGDIVIGVMDMAKYSKEANQNLSPLMIDGFPTILSFDNKGRYFSTFRGDRSEDNLKKFMSYIGNYDYIKKNMENIKGGKDEIFNM